MADNTEPQDTKALNQEAEDNMVKAQWETAKRLGLTEGYHAESINPDASAPKE